MQITNLIYIMGSVNTKLQPKSKSCTSPFQSAQMGSYVSPEICNCGQSGSVDYWKARRCASTYRDNPTMLAQSASCGYIDEPFFSAITPNTPPPVGLAGVDVFGPTSYTTLTRNMTYDIRGEAASGYLSGEPPTGASMSSYASAVPTSYYSGGQYGCL